MFSFKWLTHEQLLILPILLLNPLFVICRFGSAYFFYDLFSMYKVYNARLYDKMNLKALSSASDLYSLIPTTTNGELSFFKSMTVKDQKIPSFWSFIKRTKLMVFHHMFIGTYGLVVISSWRGGLGDCVFSFMFLMEMSTPFVSFRAVLSILNLKRSKLYFINGLLMLATFFVFRILMLPSLLYYYSMAVNLPFIQAVTRLPLGCQLSIVALFLPQFYWFNLMLKAAMRVRRGFGEGSLNFEKIYLFIYEFASSHWVQEMLKNKYKDQMKKKSPAKGTW